ncbi:Chaperone for wingless signaling and trafficking of LDL receptor [Dermatophagoides pteronyssinus]|uniref:Chaperone for wingless signaling and trafficking of LDL receptor n=1 Tax=Dermatophagoides pteronyssinus TaxID=6956 RepID=A0ABQ8J719_DERPT|nr:Chaperone for wingless signaling and trafficking of LDL receptor [Dermatophagoides pteronyssinus]
MYNHHYNYNIILLIFLISLSFINCNEKNWKQKDIRDYNDADLERLFDQWEENEEPLPEDELPEHLRKSPQLDMTKMDFSNPENVLKLSKKGKTLMAFVSVDEMPTRDETETITSLWQSSLQNNHIICDRFIVDDNRAIFMFKDGSQAWDAKEFLIKQKRCKDVTIENKVYPGIYSKQEKEEL